MNSNVVGPCQTESVVGSGDRAVLKAQIGEAIILVDMNPAETGGD